MSLVDVDSWITEYDACDRLSNEIQSQIVQRKAQPTNGPEYARLSGVIFLRLKQFGNELGQLGNKVRSVHVTRAEEERRRRTIETLQTKLIHLETQFAEDNEERRRETLFQKRAPSLWDDDDDDDDVGAHVPFNAAVNGHNAGRFAGGGGGGDGSGAVVPPTNLSVQEMRRQHDRILGDQDEGLDALAKIISRQKHLALRIGDEVDEQNDIIDDLAINVDNVDSRINSETQHVRTVSTLEQGTCGYWVVIIALFVAIIIVAII